MKTPVFWDMTSCRLVYTKAPDKLAASIFKEIQLSSTTLLMGAASSFKMLINTYQSTRYHIPANWNVLQHYCANLKGHTIFQACMYWILNWRLAFFAMLLHPEDTLLRLIEPGGREGGRNEWNTDAVTELANICMNSISYETRNSEM